MSAGAILETLKGQSLDELRNEWRRRYGAAPRLRSEMLLRHVLAWRVQADAYGYLDEQTRKLLRNPKQPREPLVAPGTIIVRNWRGVRHEVEAENEGFLYNGKRWNSLSEVARAITGTRWNGRRFFNIREHGA